MSKAASFTVTFVAFLVLAAPALAGTDLRPVAGGSTIDRILDRNLSTARAFELRVPYFDPAGDQTGTAGDITISNVSNDPAGRITFDVDVLNLPVQPPSDFFELLIDADASPATGDPTAVGAEILVQLNGSATGGGTYAFGRWNGTDYTVFDPASEQVGWASGPLIVVSRTDIGVTSAFNFLEDTLVVSGTTVTGVDLAPDTGSYNYTLTGLAPPPPPPDTTPPNTRITSAPARVARAGRATFGFRSTERGSTFQCRLDRRAWRRCTSPTTFRRLALGPHTFRVRARDAAGNADPTPAIRRWLIARPPQSRQRGA
ncbi:MAG TPA: hypothetical protein VHF67_02520 [Gaiellaceae bacterium]|nr:hypothetical protein [Gaiellaceae bacterium]